MADDSVAAPPRSYREALIALSEGGVVPEDKLQGLRREETLIRAAIEYPNAFAQTGVKPSYFDGPDYRFVWSAVERVRAVMPAQGALDEPTLLAELRRVGGEARYGGALGVRVLRPIMVEQPVDVIYALDVLVPELLHRAALTLWKSRLSPLLGRVDNDPDVSGLYQETITEAYRIAIAPDGGRLGKTLSQLATEWDPKKAKVSSDIIPTGFPQIDKATGGGMGRGELFVIGGGTNHGKSYAAARMIRYQAKSGRSVLHVSVEDPGDLMTCRMLADYSKPKLEPKDIRERTADPVVVAAAAAAIHLEQGDRAYYADAQKWTVGAICSLIRRHRYIAGIDMVIVDYLQAIQPDTPGHNRTQEVSTIVAQLKRCAVECGVALVLMTQYAREQYKDGEEPTVNASKYSGDIENEAEGVVLLYRDSDGTLRVKVAKLKWARSAGMRYIIPQDETTGGLGAWIDDFSPPATRGPPMRKGTGGNGGGRKP